MVVKDGEISSRHCPSCKQDVPVANYDMHTIHCQRFLTLCPHCKESVNRRQLQEHIEENHVEVKCDACGDKVEKMDLDDHKTSHCRQRNVSCSYCEITLPACDIAEHREACGSRTEECENCARRILRKDLEAHIASGCQTGEIKLKANDHLLPGTRKDKISERFNAGQDVRGNKTTNFGSVGFPVHQNFQSPYVSRNEGFVNPLPRYGRSTPYSYLGDDLVESRFDYSALEKVKPANPPNGPTATRTSTSDKNKVVSIKAKENVKSRGELRNPVMHVDPKVEDRKAFAIPRRSTYGIPSSDSETYDADETNVAPDLTDETFLPCEFCNELLPADALGFHQATCEDSFPTEHTFPSPPRPTPVAIHPVTEPSPIFDGIPYQNEAAAYQPNGVEYTESSPDLSAPCEFCFESFPLYDLPLHQMSCLENPNIANVHSDARPRPISPPSFVRLPLSTSPVESHPPKRNPSDSHFPESETKSPDYFPLAARSSSMAHFKTPTPTKRPLAPSFVGNVSGTQSPSHSVTQLKGPSSSASNTHVKSGEEKLSRKNKQKKKTVTKPSGRTPAHFREVNVLGGRGLPMDPSSVQHDRSPVSPLVSSSSQNFSRRGFGLNVATQPQNGAGLRRNLNDSVTYSRGASLTPSTDRPSGFHSFSNPGSQRTRANVRSHTRGRSRGSRTVTISGPKRDANLKGISDLGVEERDVGSPTGLTLQGRSVKNDSSKRPAVGVNFSGPQYSGPRYDGPRYGGQRLGYGAGRGMSSRGHSLGPEQQPHSRERVSKSRLLNPPTENNWD